MKRRLLGILMAVAGVMALFALPAFASDYQCLVEYGPSAHCQTSCTSVQDEKTDVTCDSPSQVCCSDTCAYQTKGKATCRTACGTNEQKSGVCGQGGSCCLPKPPAQTQTTTINPLAPGQKTQAPVNGNQQCTGAGGFCEAGVECGPGQQFAGTCDANSVCCTAAPQTITGVAGNQACVAQPGGYCASSCEAGDTESGQCDANDKCCIAAAGASGSAACGKLGGSCTPLAQGCSDSQTAAAIDCDDGSLCCLNTSGGTGSGATPAAVFSNPNAGFDSLAQKYGFSDPLGLLGTNKIPSLINRIITNALPYVGSLFLVILIAAGVMYLTAGGDAKKVANARRLLVNAVIGILIVIFAYAIVTGIVGYIAQSSGAK